jgi:hypothetical protein
MAQRKPAMRSAASGAFASLAAGVRAIHRLTRISIAARCTVRLATPLLRASGSRPRP